SFVPRPGPAIGMAACPWPMPRAALRGSAPRRAGDFSWGTDVPGGLMGRKRACVALMVAAAGLVFGAPAAPVAAQQGAPVAAAPAAGNVASAWAASVWSAAQRDDHAALDRLLADIPAGVDPRGELVQSVSLLKKNIEARETRSEERRVGKECR